MGKIADITTRKEWLNVSEWEKRDLTDGDFFCIDNEYIDQYANECGHQGSMVYMALCRYSGRNQTCFPGVVLMEKMLGMSRKSVIKGLGELEKRGIIKIDRLKGKSNIYTLINKKVWGKRANIPKPNIVFEEFTGMCGSCGSEPDGCPSCIGGIHWIERAVNAQA